MKTYISLFSSAGIGCYGFKLEGFECVATNELIARRLEVQKFNKKCKYETGYICGDITTEETKTKLFEQIELWKELEGLKEVDVVIATPPCQGMSVANHKKTNNEIIRNSLVIESIKFIKEIQPKFFIFENVPAFMKTICTDLDGTTNSIENAILNQLGMDFSIYADVINFKNHGACSSRSRTLVIAVRKDISDFISPIEFFPDRKNEKTLRNVIGHLKPLRSLGEIDDNDIYHAFRPYPEHMRKWISELAEGESAFDNTNPKCIPHRVINGEVVFNKQKNGDKYRRQLWDRVGPCIHTRNDQLASQNTVHPADDRVFSIRELMLMMCVPPTFQWSNTPYNILNQLPYEDKQRYLKKEEIKIRQSLGEAVPTCIIQDVAKKISYFLSQRHLKKSDIIKEIEAHELSDTSKLIRYIQENALNLGCSTLRYMAELANAKRTENAAYFTNKSIITEIVRHLPEIYTDEIHILEPSVGVGNFLNLITRKYCSIKRVVVDIVDIDGKSLSLLRALLEKDPLPKNVELNYINDDFLLHIFEKKYDVVIGNPPFIKSHLSASQLSFYKKQVYNTDTSNTFSFFLEKAISLSNFVAMITPKALLNTPEFEKTRHLLKKMRISSILDFGEKGFDGVLVETICMCMLTKQKPGKTSVQSIPLNKFLLQNQSYITDSSFPYWIIYRNSYFDAICAKMSFDIFNVFRDRQITNSLSTKNGIRVIRSRNITEDGTNIIDIPGYDFYIDPIEAEKLTVYQFLNRDDVYLTPNMTYKPRVILKPKHVLANGSAAILILKHGQIPLTKAEMMYFASEEYREFYRIARNHQTRSLNVDANSVFFFGRKI